MEAERKVFDYFRKLHLHLGIAMFILLYIVLLIKFISLSQLSENIIFTIYGILIAFYVFIRFILGFFYDPKFEPELKSYQPTITFGVPSKNEEQYIKKTLRTIGAIQYPKHKFSIIAIDDGSTDKTYEKMIEAKEVLKKKGIQMNVLRWKKNRGKRAGMAEVTRLAKGEIVIFIDSDSFIEKRSVSAFVKYFTNPQVGAVSGHAFVANRTQNLLTRMQAARYYIAFKAYKGAESLHGAVTCCSGCCAAYRRAYIKDIVDEWEKQTFLGVPCTYGDDRSLTNSLLERGYHTLYAPDVVSYTIVPDTFSKFMKQQLRWKKSWFRETLRASFFMWRRNVITSVIFYLGFILTLLAPFLVFRALIWLPLVHGKYPFQYLFGLFVMSAIYALYYFFYTKDRQWIYEILFSTVYTILLIWQLPWAILTIRDTRWGTR